MVFTETRTTIAHVFFVFEIYYSLVVWLTSESSKKWCIFALDKFFMAKKGNFEIICTFLSSCAGVLNFFPICLAHCAQWWVCVHQTKIFSSADDLRKISIDNSHFLERIITHVFSCHIKIKIFSQRFSFQFEKMNKQYCCWNYILHDLYCGVWKSVVKAMWYTCTCTKS